MPVGNMIFRAAKGNIWDKPQTDVGPGQYNINDPQFAPKHGVAPFSSTVERRTGELPLNTPGPGAYATNISSIKLSNVPSPQFASKVERMEGEKQRLRMMDYPGPGAYTGEIVKELPNRRGPERKFHSGSGINWVKVTTAPSVPSLTQNQGYEEGPGGRLIQQPGQMLATGIPGPGSYEPTLEMVKNHGRLQMSFGKPHNLSRVPDPTPGPGTYDACDLEKRVFMRGGVGSTRQHAVFASDTERTDFAGNSFGPGPGAFPIKGTFKSLNEYLAANPDSFSAFGSCCKDAHPGEKHPDVPGPGTYYDGVIRATRSTARSVPIFASGSQRFSDIVNTTPGPGVYEDYRTKFNHDAQYKATGMFGVFGSTSPRFERERRDEFPPVGAYDTSKGNFNPAEARRYDQRTSVFRSMSQRSVEAVKTDKPIFYDGKKAWPKPQTTNKGFISTVPRFTYNDDNGVLGPGAYDARIYDPRSDPGRAPSFGKASRFLTPLYEKTPGPGTYHSGDSSLIKKTFNITIG